MYWDIVTATVASIVLGFLWYGPFFGKQWMKLMKITPKQMAEGKKKGMPATTYLLMIVGAIMTAYVLKLVLLQFPFSAVKSLLLTAVVLWLGFFVPTGIGSVLWEGRPWKLFFINVGYNLVNLIVMTVVYLLF